MARKKGVHKDISKEFKGRPFYDFIFWLGMIFLIASYFIEELNIFMLGMILLLLSLLIYELHHKPINKRLYAFLFYFLISLLILYLLYISREKIFIIFGRPFSGSLLFVLYGLAILTLIVIVYEWLKGQKTSKKTADVKISAKIKIIQKKEEVKKPGKLKIFFRALTLVFFISFIALGLYILVPYWPYRQWLVYIATAVIILTIILFLIYLYLKEQRKIQKKIKEMKEKKGGVPLKIRKLEGYETDFDVLYDIVQQKGKIKISQVAKIFNVPKKQVEEWAEILEEHNLVKMHYPPVGEPELMKIVEKKKNE